MLLNLLGTPSAFTAWGSLALRTIVDVAHGSSQYIPAVKFEDFEKAFKSRSADRVIVFSDSPDVMMADLLLRVRVPTVIFFEEPDDVVGYVMKSRNLDLGRAIKFACLSYTCLSAFLRLADIKLYRRGAQTKTEDLILSLAAHYGISLKPSDVREILRRLAGDDLGDARYRIEAQILKHAENARPIGGWASDLGKEGRGLVEATLRPYVDMLLGRRFDAISWPKQLFFSGNVKGEYVSGPIEMAGRARFLMYGPHLHLPAGDWLATLHIDIGESFSHNTVVADVKCGEVLSSGRIELPEEGSFMFTLPFKTTDPRVPVEFRFLLERGAIEGWIDLVALSVEAVPARG